MDYAEIDLKIVKKAVNAILEHLIEDLRLEKVVIDAKEDFYWDCPVLSTAILEREHVERWLQHVHVERAESGCRAQWSWSPIRRRWPADQERGGNILPVQRSERSAETFWQYR